ncbi:MAG: hypothetical protein IPK60_22945 [Sandaracinaceae bacterium]|nr:hypothetical protein [Sandaracinaceae bacterium]
MRRAKTHFLQSIGESGVAKSLCSLFGGQCAQDMELVTCRMCLVILREPVTADIVYPRPAPLHMQRTGCRTELRIDKEIAERARWRTWFTAALQLIQWRDDGFPMKSTSDPGRFEAVSVGKSEADGDRAQRIAGEFAIVSKLLDAAYQLPWVIQHTPRLEISPRDCTTILETVVAGRIRANGKGRESIDPVEIAAMATEALGFEVTRTDVVRIARQGGASIENGLHARGLVSHRDLRLQVEDMADAVNKPWDYSSVNEIADALDQSPTTIRRWMSLSNDPLPTKTILGKTVAVKAEIEAWLSRHVKAA